MHKSLFRISSNALSGLFFADASPENIPVGSATRKFSRFTSTKNSPGAHHSRDPKQALGSPLHGSAYKIGNGVKNDGCSMRFC